MGSIELTRSFLTDRAVRRDVYRDPEIFRLERERIFSKVWMFVGHMGEFTKPGDFKTTVLNGAPILIWRDEGDEVRAFYNSCMHRGTVVTRRLRGNDRFMRCMYHAWTYGRDGSLIGVPDAEAYDERFDKSNLGLTPVPRIARTRHGLIFASQSPEVEPLEQHLGEALKYMDACFVDPTGYTVAGYHDYRVAGNWKLVTENSTDGYHARYLHRTMAQAARAQGGGMTEKEKQAGDKPNNYQIGLPGGHNLMSWESMAVERMMDPKADAQGKRRRDYIGSIFPNLAINTNGNCPKVRQIIPIDVDCTEIVQYALIPNSYTREERRAYLVRLAEYSGPAGANGVDDNDNFPQVQKGLRAPIEWSDVSRGAGKATGELTDEVAMHALFREWERRMFG